jgi:hypothetical protein
MAVAKPRNRTVLFRLTEEEFGALQAACTAGGARSLSDYARHRILTEGAQATSSVARLERQVGELTCAIERLIDLIDRARHAGSAAA